MGIRARLVLVIVFAALLPLAVLGAGAISESGDVLEETVGELQVSTAESLALGLDTLVAARISQLERQVKSFDVDALDTVGRTAFVRLAYKQTEDARIVTLFDRASMGAMESAWLDAPLPGDLAGRAVVDGETAAAWLDSLPGLVTSARDASGWRRVGAPRRDENGLAPVVPVLIPADPTGRLVLAVQLGLESVQASLGRTAGEKVDVTLIDQDGGLVFAGNSGLVDPEVFVPLLGTSASEVHYRTAHGIQVIAACAPVPSTGWLVVVAEPINEFLSTVRDFRSRTLFIGAIAVVLAVVLGVLLARDVSVPVIALRDAALAIAEGDLRRRVHHEGKDEVGDLGRAFNFMGERLAHNQAEIALKNAEIEKFNEELQQRVEDRTRELREAQQQLVHSARLAAVGEMGAGLAHELNNPMAGILGLVQVLAAKRQGTQDEAFLRSIEEQAVRCKDIVAQMQRFSQLQSDPGSGPSTKGAVVELDAVIADVLSLIGGAMRDRGVVVENGTTPGLRTRGDAAELGQALAQLMASVRGAAAPGSVVRLESRQDGRQLVLDVALRGPELRVGADDWKASGMGFWAASQVFTAHGGALRETTVDPEGAAAAAGWRVILPGA